jgi:hypothetical protein
MARYTVPAFKTSRTTRYLVLWDLQQRALDCQCLEPGSDLRGAMAGAIERLASDGWQAEGSADYGSVFVQRAGERRLLMLTERDPFSTTVQSFSPFRRA